MTYRFACLGDSITSDQVTGIGTVVCKKLQMELVGNYACGWATCSDWHDGDVNLTTPLYTQSPNEYSPQNVLSNQVLHLLSDCKNRSLSPNVIYIAIGTNDGSVDWRMEQGTPTPIVDDFETVCELPYKVLTKTSIASALRWAIETLRDSFPNAQFFVASPLQAYSPDREQGAFSEEAGLIKREILRKVISSYQDGRIHFIDSYLESGFTREVAKEHGEVHPDELWKEKIADYVASSIRSRLI